MNYKTGVNAFHVFTPEQVRKINKEIEKNILGAQTSSYGAQNVSKIGKFSHVRCGPLMDLIHPWLYQCQETNRNFFGYDIDWDYHLSILNYNVYGTGDEYGWHIDATHDKIFDMKLTCLLNLSEEPYEGGEFHTMSTNEKIEFTSGMMLVFTSLISHKVTPITKGERRTLTYWGLGPSWR
jgi:predicted 2-oxoglutarate/Fe(II)-dependent dioxygenase YbiX